MRRRVVPLAVAGVLATAGAAVACGAISIGDPGSSLGRTLYLTYDINRDASCGGTLGFEASRVIVQGRFGQVTIAGGRFRYVAAPGGAEGDRFVVQGLRNNKPARLSVNVKFQ